MSESRGVSDWSEDFVYYITILLLRWKLHRLALTAPIFSHVLSMIAPPSRVLAIRLCGLLLLAMSTKNYIGQEY
jgi:hypothetical protein